MHRLDLLPPMRGLSFEEERHIYTVQSKQFGTLIVPSTSQVMQATGAKCMNYSAWRNSLLRNGTCKTVEGADAFMEQHRTYRAEVGTDFHHLAQCTLLDVKPRVVQEESIEMLGVWRELFLPRITGVSIIELPMFHRACFFAGTPDLLAVIDGELTLCDWKTQQAGKEKVRTEWLLQVGAYAELIRAAYGIELQKAAMVIVTTAGVRIQPYNWADIQQGWQRFAGFLAELHARQAVLGSIPHHIALTAMRPMFS
jgi:hypothetical protein